MGTITVVNNTAGWISVTISDKDSWAAWYTLAPNGGTDSWSRSNNEVVFIAKSTDPGSSVETRLGVPDSTMYVD